jgi:hypothetical protein
MRDLRRRQVADRMIPPRHQDDHARRHELDPTVALLTEGSPRDVAKVAGRECVLDERSHDGDARLLRKRPFAGEKAATIRLTVTRQCETQGVAHDAKSCALLGNWTVGIVATPFTSNRPPSRPPSSAWTEREPAASAARAHRATAGTEISRWGVSVRLAVSPRGHQLAGTARESGHVPRVRSRATSRRPRYRDEAPKTRGA